ncbi:MAG: hypothetical protein JXR19_09440 [Bacteroidia bacterium]
MKVWFIYCQIILIAGVFLPNDLGAINRYSIVKEPTKLKSIKLVELYGSFSIWGPLNSTSAIDRYKMSTPLYSLTATSASRWGLTLSYHEDLKSDENTPSDYIPGTGLCGLFDDNHFYEQLSFYTLRLRRSMILKDKLRYAIELGPSFIHIRGNEFMAREIYRGFWCTSSNYHVIRKLNDVLGASVQASVEFPFAKLIGARLALRSEVSTVRTSFLIEGGIGIGLFAQKT